MTRRRASGVVCEKYSMSLISRVGGVAVAVAAVSRELGRWTESPRGWARYSARVYTFPDHLRRRL